MTAVGPLDHPGSAARARGHVAGDPNRGWRPFGVVRPLVPGGTAIEMLAIERSLGRIAVGLVQDPARLAERDPAPADHVLEPPAVPGRDRRRREVEGAVSGVMPLRRGGEASGLGRPLAERLRAVVVGRHELEIGDEAIAVELAHREWVLRVGEAAMSRRPHEAAARRPDRSPGALVVPLIRPARDGQEDLSVRAVGIGAPTMSSGPRRGTNSGSAARIRCWVQ